VKHKAKILFTQIVNSKDYYVLLGRRISSNESFWWIPGGSVEPGENEFEAGLRELDEELVLLSPYIDALQLFSSSLRQPEKIQYRSLKAFNTIFIVLLREQTFDLPGIKDEFEEMAWFNIDQLPENMSREFEYIRDEFIKTIKKIV